VDVQRLIIGLDRDDVGNLAGAIIIDNDVPLLVARYLLDHAGRDGIGPTSDSF
jgi:hypothetical protein